jgi:hypothetical protein
MVTTVGLNASAFGGDGQAVAEAASDAFSNNWPAANQGTQWTYLGVVIRLGQDGGPPAVYEAVRARVGTQAITSVVNNVAVLIRKNTARGGRPGRGRMYLPPFIVDQVSVSSVGLLNTALLAGMQNLATSWLVTSLATVVLHDSAAPGGTTPSPILSVTVQPRVATQRRRLRP